MVRGIASLSDFGSCVLRASGLCWMSQDNLVLGKGLDIITFSVHRAEQTKFQFVSYCTEKGADILDTLTMDTLDQMAVCRD